MSIIDDFISYRYISLGNKTESSWAPCDHELPVQKIKHCL